MFTNFKPKSLVTPFEQALYDNIHMIVMKNLPLYFATDPEFRNFSKHNVEFGKATFTETIFKLVELVESKIAEEMEKAGKGSILHD
eukprot:6996353-Ditylum_brightwellii.AAC.1